MSAQRSLRSNGYGAQNIFDPNINNSGIWTTQNGPPSYENIYNSSLPINPPPDYETAQKKNFSPNGTTENAATTNSKATENMNTLLFTQNETTATTTAPVQDQAINIFEGEVDTVDNPLFNLNIVAQGNANNASMNNNDESNVSLEPKDAENTHEKDGDDDNNDNDENEDKEEEDVSFESSLSDNQKF